MTVVLFIAVLVVLIVVHELGHFFAAKWAGMRVEEFGVGYPPRAVTLAKKNGTDYTLNWLPFGGFVKIKGEDDGADTTASDSFGAKKRIVQALVLVAGIFMNLVFAWVLLSITLTLGMPRTLEGDAARTTVDAELIVSRVVAGTPAESAGLMAGDVITSVQSGKNAFTGTSAEDFTAFIASSGTQEAVITIERNEEPMQVTVTPATNIIPADPERAALGVGVATVGTRALEWWQAPYEGLLITIEATKQIAVGLVLFFGSIFSLNADLSQVAGPVGIAGAVGDASETSLAALLTLTAVISINLALVNLLPVPALDGGRLLFVIIESITRRPIPKSFANAANSLGFALLILLMVAITASDILKLIG